MPNESYDVGIEANASIRIITNDATRTHEQLVGIVSRLNHDEIDTESHLDEIVLYYNSFDRVSHVTPEADVIEAHLRGGS